MVIEFFQHRVVENSARKFHENLNKKKIQNYVVAGEELELPPNSFTGHGIQKHDSKYFASCIGKLITVNSLTYVESIYSCYNPVIGDLVIGRISTVDNGKWTVDIGSTTKARLNPKSLTLSSGEQRCKTANELTDLRQFFVENDLILAEVKNITLEETCYLHTRNNKYVKLVNGCLICVPLICIKRISDHIFTLFKHVQVILGNNGLIWISTVFMDKESDTKDDIESKSNGFTNLESKDRYIISRVRNSILILSKYNAKILPTFIEKIYISSLNLQLGIDEMLKLKNTLILLRFCIEN